MYTIHVVKQEYTHIGTQCASSHGTHSLPKVHFSISCSTTRGDAAKSALLAPYRLQQSGVK